MIKHLKKHLGFGRVRILLKNKIPFHLFSREKIGRFVLDYPSRSHFYSLFYEIFIDESYRVDGLRSCKKIIDAGANIGVSVVYFASRYPQAQIVCFEPNPEALEYLKKNVEQNKITATIYPYALGAREGRTQFFVDADIRGASSSGVVKFLASKQRPIRELEVNVRTLSAFINEPVDILKIDIEGEETNVLLELVESKKINYIQNIFIEFHYDPIYLPQSLSKFLAILEDSGFFYYLSKRQTVTIPVQTLHSYNIFAFRKHGTA